MDIGLTKGSIKYDVASIGELSITLFNEIAIDSCFRVIREHMECVVELFRINFALSFTPSSLRVGGNRLQISFSCLGKAK